MHYNQTIVHQYLDLLLSVLSILLGGDFCNWYNVQKQPLIALVPSNTLNIAFLSLKDFVAKNFLMTSIISEVFHVKFTIPRKRVTTQVVTNRVHKAQMYASKSVVCAKFLEALQGFLFQYSMLLLSCVRSDSVLFIDWKLFYFLFISIFWPECLDNV